ncbi:hypothetical protein NKG94_39465 [Micromonospora sp. M12]
MTGAGGAALRDRRRSGVVSAAARRGVALLDTATIFDHDDHHARAQVSGTASDLLLALWGRVSFETLDVAGDRNLLNGLRTG